MNGGVGRITQVLACRTLERGKDLQKAGQTSEHPLKILTIRKCTSAASPQTVKFIEALLKRMKAFILKPLLALVKNAEDVFTPAC